MHAHASEYLLNHLQPGSKVLDVGSGSGYLTAIFHYLVSPGSGQPTGKVVGIDHMAELVNWSVENLKGDGLGPALGSGQIVMIAGDGREGKPIDPFVSETPFHLHPQVILLLAPTTASTLGQPPRQYHKR